MWTGLTMCAIVEPDSSEGGRLHRVVAGGRAAKVPSSFFSPMGAKGLRFEVLFFDIGTKLVPDNEVARGSLGGMA